MLDLMLKSSFATLTSLTAAAAGPMRLIVVCGLCVGSVFGHTHTVLAQQDDTAALKTLLRRADGDVARLQAKRTYYIREKLQLKSLCPNGITIEGNNAVVKALPGFEQSVLLTATELLKDEPYDPGVTIRRLTLDGDGRVGRCVFGNWKNARIHELRVKGGTDYQVNAIWNNSTLSNIRVVGDPRQTNNGFDCNLQDTTIWNISVDMNGNLKECGLWLNGSKNADIINAYLTDGRSAFGLENCKDVNLINLNARGQFSFRVVNILPADPSERIHLYDVNVNAEHVGKDPSSGIHFNATRGGMVVRGKVVTSGPGVMLSNGASDVDVIDVALPSRAVHPVAEWAKTGRQIWTSKRRQSSKRLNRPPVVYAGPDKTVRGLVKVALVSAVADERDVNDLTVTWSQVTGPGDVRFDNATRPRAHVDFAERGVYTLRLSANDGEFENTDDVTITAGLVD